MRDRRKKKSNFRRNNKASKEHPKPTNTNTLRRNSPLPNNNYKIPKKIKKEIPNILKRTKQRSKPLSKTKHHPKQITKTYNPYPRRRQQNTNKTKIRYNLNAKAKFRRYIFTSRSKTLQKRNNNILQRLRNQGRSIKRN